MKVLRQGTVPVITIVFKVLHASVTSSTLRSLDVYPHTIEGTRRSAGDLQVVVGSPRHNVLFGIALITLIIYVVGFPLVAAVMFFPKRRRGNFRELRNRFKSWMEGLSITRLGFLWPSIVLFRKLLLQLVTHFVGDGFDQYILVTSILVLSYRYCRTLV